MRTEEIRDQQVFANDDVAEPFQPAPTWERWRQQELWQNREGTVVRTGLYLKDRKEIADNFAEGDKNLEEVKKGYQDADAILEGLIDDTKLVAQQAAQDATNSLNKVLEVDSGYKAADNAIVKTVNANKAASDAAEKALNDRIDQLPVGSPAEVGTITGAKGGTTYFSGAVLGTELKDKDTGDSLGWSFYGSVTSNSLKVGDDITGVTVDWEPLSGTSIPSVQAMMSGLGVGTTSDNKFVMIEIKADAAHPGSFTITVKNTGESADGSDIVAYSILIT